jgi:hypothetical protein
MLFEALLLPLLDRRFSAGSIDLDEQHRNAYDDQGKAEGVEPAGHETDAGRHGGQPAPASQADLMSGDGPPGRAEPLPQDRREAGPCRPPGPPSPGLARRRWAIVGVFRGLVHGSQEPFVAENGRYGIREDPVIVSSCGIQGRH